ncbi:MAG: hypothetical protein EGR10_03470 [Megasphaera elsdenii]|nr:hypothetical protein [Megasphaera elsdenii]
MAGRKGIEQMIQAQKSNLPTLPKQFKEVRQQQKKRIKHLKFRIFVFIVLTLAFWYGVLSGGLYLIKWILFN